MLHPCDCGSFPVERDEWFVVDNQVFTDVWVDAGGLGALGADLLIPSAHLVHVGRWRAQVGDVPFEVGALRQILRLREYRLFGARTDESPLVRGDGAETASAEAPSVNGDGVLNHGPRRYFAALGVLRVWCIHHGIEEREMVHLLLRCWRIGRVNYERFLIIWLNDSALHLFVALRFKCHEVLAVKPFVAQFLLERMEYECFAYVAVFLRFIGEKGDL